MMLLFDQNLSPKLTQRLADIYPNSTHVSVVGLSSAPDDKVWEYADRHNYLIVTKDVDFSEFSMLWGFPPKVIWIRRGNCSTNIIEDILRNHHDIISEFSQNDSLGIITLY